MPYKTAQIMLSASDISKINVQAKSNENVTSAMGEIKDYFTKKGMAPMDFMYLAIKKC